MFSTILVMGSCIIIVSVQYYKTAKYNILAIRCLQRKKAILLTILRAVFPARHPRALGNRHASPPFPLRRKSLGERVCSRRQQALQAYTTCRRLHSRMLCLQHSPNAAIQTYIQCDGYVKLQPLHCHSNVTSKGRVHIGQLSTLGKLSLSPRVVCEIEVTSEAILVQYDHPLAS